VNEGIYPLKHSYNLNPAKYEMFNGTNRLLDKYSVTGLLGRFASNYLGFDIPDIGSNTVFSG